MLRLTLILSAALVLALLSLNVFAFDLQATPDQYIGPYGAGLCLEKINNDNYLDVLSSIDWLTYGDEVSGYMFNGTPNGYPCSFTTPFTQLPVGAHEIISGYIRGTNNFKDLAMANYIPYNPPYQPYPTVDATRIYTNYHTGTLSNPQVISNLTVSHLALGRVGNNDWYDDLVATPGSDGHTI
jgi:hypothetical protein